MLSSQVKRLLYLKLITCLNCSVICMIRITIDHPTTQYLFVLQKLQLQLLYLTTQRHDGLGAFVLIQTYLVLDVSGSIGVLQSVEGFHEVAITGGHAGYHHCARVA